MTEYLLGGVMGYSISEIAGRLGMRWALYEFTLALILGTVLVSLGRALWLLLGPIIFGS